MGGRFIKRALILLIVAAIAVVGIAAVRFHLKTRQFSAALDKQLQSIDRICAMRPASWAENEWNNLQFTHNVWANVLYGYFPDTPTPDEMARLQTELDEILAQTTPDNSIDSIDRVYELMLTVRGVNREFSERHRNGFRECVAAHQQSQ